MGFFTKKMEVCDEIGGEGRGEGYEGKAPQDMD